MTDIYSFEEARRRQLSSDVMSSYDMDPEDAARARGLSRMTGDPASVIALDTKAYETNMQRVLGSRIVTSNDELQEFVRQNPLNAAIAQDDWDNLSDYAQALRSIGREGQMYKDGKYRPMGVIRAAYQGFNEYYEQHGGPFDELVKGLQENMPWLYAARIGYQHGVNILDIANKSMRGLGALAGAAQGGMMEILLDHGVEPRQARQLSRGIGAGVEWLMQDVAHIGVTLPAGQKFIESHPRVDPRMALVQRWEAMPPDVQKVLAPVVEANNLMKPYIDAGTEIPAGLHPLIDETLKEQSKYDMDLLKEAQKRADKTNLKERSPQSLEEFTRVGAGERFVEIDVDAIAGNKEAFKWIADLDKQIEDALPHGDRVRVPLEQWILNTDPEVRQAFADYISIRPGANNANDWKIIPEPMPSVFRERWNENSDSTRLWDAVEAERKAAKLEPLPAVGKIPERLQLMRGKPVPWPELKGEHSFMITDEIGRHVADLEIDTKQGGKELHVKWIGGRYVPHQIQQPVTNIFGPSLMRDLFRRLREEFPEAETISGRRISGARDGTVKEGETVTINIDALRAEVEDPAILGQETLKFMDVTESGEWRNVGDRIMYQTHIRGDLPVEYQQVVNDISAIFDRILPPEMRGRAGATKRVLLDGRPVYGVMQGAHDALPVILWSVSLGDKGAARHEAMHFLRAYGYISDKEWDILVNTAEKEKWIEKYEIDKHYKGATPHEKLEEAVAWELQRWSEHKPATAYSGVFGRIQRLLEEIKDYFKELFGREPTATDIFQKIERGTVGRRKMGRVEEPYFDPSKIQLAGPMPSPLAAMGPTPKAPFLPKLLQQSERPIFEPGALMPAERQRRYEKEMEAQRTRDIELQQKAAAQELKKQANEKWLDAAAEKLPRIQDEIRNSPPFMIDRLFREGMLGDVKLDKRPKIGREYVSPDLLERIPENWLSKKGENPDVLAPMVGLANGEEFLHTISAFQLARGELGPKAFFEKSVGIRLQREMEKEFGKRGDMVLREAQDHVYNDGQLGLLHQDTLAAAAALGQELSFTKEDVARQMEYRLNKLLMKDANFKNTTTALYRAGGKLEDANLRGDAIEAFKQSQRKENAFALAVAIRRLEKEQDAHERVVKAYRKREPDGRDQQLTPFIHDVLERMGESSRPAQDIQTEITKGDYGSWQKLNDFFIEQHGLKIIPEFLMDPNWRKDPRFMTVEEWRGANDFLTIMDKFSRETQSYTIQGEKFALRDLIDNKMVPQIQLGTKALEEMNRIDKPGPGVTKKFARAYYAQHLQLETVFNWFDRNHRKGIFNQGIIREYTTAANRSEALDKEFGGMINAINKKHSIKSPYKLVNQALFRNPDTGEVMQLSRMNVLGAFANSGNPSNFYSMLDGYKIPHEMGQAVFDMMFKNMTREDVVRQMELGKIFKHAKDMSDAMYRRLTGVAPLKIDTWSIQTPWKDLGQNGLIEGWWHPLIYDTRFKQSSEKFSAPSPLEFPVWTKSNLPAAGYTKERTGYKGPIHLDLEQFDHRLQMIVRDVAWREPLTQLTKIFKDPEFRGAIRNHWGPHIEALLDPFLRDIAGQREAMSYNDQIGNATVQFIRQNIISHMVGLNPSTIAKHSITAAYQSMNEVGAMDFGRELFGLLRRNEETGERNWWWAISKSEELQRRHRNAYEGITGNFDRTYGHLKTTGVFSDMKAYLENFNGRPLSEKIRIGMGDIKGSFMRLRDFMLYWESYPMAFFDMLSAVPTWLARYRQAKMAGENEGMALYMADTSVRRAHGSSVITSRTEFQRSPMAVLFANFYSFFSHILQRQLETAWATKAAMRGEGYYIKQPAIAGDGSVAPPEIELAKRGRDVAEENPTEYKKTDDFKYGSAMIAPLAGMFFAYYVFPAWWDEIVAPHHGEKGIGPDKKESWLKYIGLVQLHGLGGSWGYARDVVQAMTSGGEVSAGLMGEGAKSLINLFRDVGGKTGLPKTLEKKQKFIRDANSVWNIMTGFGMPNSVPRMGIFGYNWYYKKEKPKSFREFWTGLTRGTAHPKH